MKLKLYLASIFLLISFVAYQKYSEYSTLKSIDSYESCAAAKGSIIQESYPATCITRLGVRFTQPVQPQVAPQSIYQEVKPKVITAQALTKVYTSKKYNFSFQYPQNWTISTHYKGDFATDLEYTVVSPSESVSVTPEGIVIKVLPFNSDKLSISWFQDNILKSYGENITIEKFGIKETIFSGNTALIDNNGTIYLTQNHYLYIISWGYVEESNQKVIQDIYNQILPTFKFTN